MNISKGLAGIFVLMCIFSTMSYAGYSLTQPLEFHIKGEIAGEVMYEWEKSVPVSDSAENSFGRVRSQTNLTDWWGFDVFSCQATANTMYPYYQENETADSRASITMFFQPQGNSYEIHTQIGVYNPPFGALGYVSITDMMTGFPLIVSEGIHPINPDRIYKLYVYAGTNVDCDYNGAEATVWFMVTPEPASLLLLALGGLGVRKRKEKRRKISDVR